MRRVVLAAIALLLILIAVVGITNGPGVYAAMQVGVGYVAHQMCACQHIAGRDHTLHFGDAERIDQERRTTLAPSHLRHRLEIVVAIVERAMVLGLSPQHRRHQGLQHEAVQHRHVEAAPALRNVRRPGCVAEAAALRSHELCADTFVPAMHVHDRVLGGVPLERVAGRVCNHSGVRRGGDAAHLEARTPPGIDIRRRRHRGSEPMGRQDTQARRRRRHHRRHHPPGGIVGGSPPALPLPERRGVPVVAVGDESGRRRQAALQLLDTLRPMPPPQRVGRTRLVRCFEQHRGLGGIANQSIDAAARIVVYDEDEAEVGAHQPAQAASFADSVRIGAFVRLHRAILEGRQPQTSNE